MQVLTTPLLFVLTKILVLVHAQAHERLSNSAGALLHPRPNDLVANLAAAAIANMTHDQHVAARGTYAGVYYCSQANWEGKCQYTVASGGACHKFDSNGGDGSFGPDMNIRCTIYEDPGCSMNKKELQYVTYNGIIDLWSYSSGLVGSAWIPTSFQCKWCWGCLDEKPLNNDDPLYDPGDIPDTHTITSKPYLPPSYPGRK